MVAADVPGSGLDAHPAGGKVLPTTRWLALFIIPFLVVAAVILWFLPDQTGRLFAWPIRPPMTAMLLGTAYAGGIYFFTRVAFARQWHRVKVGFLPVATFSSLLCVATVLHWDRFTHGHVSFWTWVLLYFVALNQEQFTAAEQWCDVGSRRFREDPRFSACRLILLAWTGAAPDDVQQAWRQLQTMELADSAGVFASQWGTLRMLTAMVAARAGLRDSAAAIMATVHAGSAVHPGSSFRIEEANVRLLLGQRDSAVRLLAEELREDPLARGKVLRSPWFRAIATDQALRPTGVSAP